MAKTATFTKTGTKAQTSATLPQEIFELEVKNHDLLKRAYLAYLANKRVATARTKTRGEVRGGGRKPHIQKGTGRARAGSIRQPNWVGGGVVFGPTGGENYQLNLNKKSRRLAIKQALSLKHKAEAVVVIEDFTVKNGKTSEATALLGKIGAQRRVLVVVENKEPKLQRAIANIPNTELVQARYLNVYKVMNADCIILTKAAITAIEAWLVTGEGKKQTESAKPAAKAKTKTHAKTTKTKTKSQPKTKTKAKAKAKAKATKTKTTGGKDE